MITLDEFLILWNKKINKKEKYFISKKYNKKIKYTNLYKMYCYTNNMNIVRFKTAVNRFFETNFKKWKERIIWIGKNYKNKSITKDKMIAYYGDEEGLKRWNSYREKQSYTNSFEYKNI